VIFRSIEISIIYAIGFVFNDPFGNGKNSLRAEPSNFFFKERRNE